MKTETTIPRSSLIVWFVLSQLSLIYSVQAAGNPAAPQNQPLPHVDCTKECNPPVDVVKGVPNVEIDANDGTVLNGGTYFPGAKGVRVVVKNKNPFRYKYSISLKGSSAQTALVTSFLSLIPGVGDILSQASGQVPKVIPKAEFCTGQKGINDIWNSITLKIVEVTTLSKNLKNDLNSRSTSLDEYNKFLTDTTGDSINCSDICPRAASLYPQLSSLSDLGDIPNRLDNLKTGITDLDKMYGDLDKAVKAAAVDECTGRNKTEQEKYKPLRDQISKDAAGYDTVIKKLQSGKDGFNSLAKVIYDALSSPNPFVEVKSYFPQPGEDTITTTIKRTDLRSPAATVADINVPIVVRVPTTFLSAGFGFSTIGDRIVVRQSSLVPDPNDSSKTVLGARFGYQNNSTFKPSAVIMLNEMLWHWSDYPGVAVGGSLGLVISNRNETTEAEFIIGPSLSFNHNKMFLTFGFHAARQQQLAGGFKIGDQVPASLQDPLPLQKNFKAGFMFAMTFKLK